VITGWWRTTRLVGLLCCSLLAFLLLHNLDGLDVLDLERTARAGQLLLDYHRLHGLLRTMSLNLVQQLATDDFPKRLRRNTKTFRRFTRNGHCPIMHISREDAMFPKVVDGLQLALEWGVRRGIRGNALGTGKGYFPLN
jgi:hypothetical protein